METKMTIDTSKNERALARAQENEAEAATARDAAKAEYDAGSPDPAVARRKFEAYVEAQGAHAYAAKALERAKTVHSDATASLPELETLAQKAATCTADVQASIAKTHYPKIAKLKRELAKTWGTVQAELNEVKAAHRAAGEFAFEHHIDYLGARGLPDGCMRAAEVPDVAESNPNTMWNAVLHQILDLFNENDSAPLGTYDARSQCRDLVEGTWWTKCAELKAAKDSATRAAREALAAQQIEDRWGA